ncbi:MAG: Bax inhibitor-1 family protein [Gammaproteobacteria bacterium]|nr:Bax inhibitor-1 family protein [Gammaproteobacteria bacterium]
MDINQSGTIERSSQSALATNTVLRNTYLLLSLTLLFSAATAGLSMFYNASFVNIWMALIVFLGFPFVLNMVRDSPLALVLTFVYTGFVGWYIGPILNLYIKEFSNGSELIMTALGSTGLIFLILSAISMNTKRDYSSWGKFLAIGVIVGIVAMITNIFLKMPMLQLGMSVIFAFISGGYIMYQTNMIVRGGETNYVIATVVLYVSLINIFLTLLQILGMFSGNRR